MEKTSFGVPEQRGNVTIYPALPAEMLRATRGGKKNQHNTTEKVSCCRENLIFTLFYKQNHLSSKKLIIIFQTLLHYLIDFLQKQTKYDFF